MNNSFVYIEKTKIIFIDQLGTCFTLWDWTKIIGEIKIGIHKKT